AQRRDAHRCRELAYERVVLRRGERVEGVCMLRKVALDVDEQSAVGGRARLCAREAERLEYVVERVPPRDRSEAAPIDEQPVLVVGDRRDLARDVVAEERPERVAQIVRALPRGAR